MPRTRLVLYREADGTVPVLVWMESLPVKAGEKCRDALKRLRELGHELRRPEADYLRDGIYELRIRFGRQNLRILYFFDGRSAVVAAHGLTKERGVPDADVERALARWRNYRVNPRSSSVEFR